MILTISVVVCRSKVLNCGILNYQGVTHLVQIHSSFMAFLKKDIIKLKNSESPLDSQHEVPVLLIFSMQICFEELVNASTAMALGNCKEEHEKLTLPCNFVFLQCTVTP